MEPNLILDSRAELGEGPSWDDREGMLYWVDIFGGQVHAFGPEGGTDRLVGGGKYVSCVVPTKDGGLAVTLEHGFYMLDPGTGKASLIAEVAEGTGTRFNDGKCDPNGRFWAGTMDIGEKAPTGSLYVLEKQAGVRTVLTGTVVSNGLGWSPDGRTMYFIDSPKREVYAFDYDAATGTVANRRTAVDFAGQPGEPDGMAVDAEGMIWVAHWGGWRVTRFDPLSGRALEALRLPVSQVTSCCFGGDELDRLYVTSASAGLDSDALLKEPLAGGLFAAETGVVGLPTNRFEG